MYIVPVSAARRWSRTSSTVPTERKNISITENSRQANTAKLLLCSHLLTKHLLLRYNVVNQFWSQ